MDGPHFGFRGGGWNRRCLGLAGPLFHFSDAWQLVINSLTNIVTFLMVFLIQRSQNKDTLALQLKVNELIAAHNYISARSVFEKPDARSSRDGRRGPARRSPAPGSRTHRLESAPTLLNTASPAS